MIDLYLRADTEAGLKSSLPWALDEEGGWVLFTERYALDLIGPVEITPAVLDVDGNLITPAEIDARYHANLRLLDETLAEQVPEAVRITVNTPSRRWAGEE